MNEDLWDFVRRMRAVLPRGWIADEAPVIDTVLSALSVSWKATNDLIIIVIDLARINTASGPFLDMICQDFFGGGLGRRTEESDSGFRERIEFELLRLRAVRHALFEALWQLTGEFPVIIEPARPADTGAYNIGGVGYSTAGALGNLALSHTCFVTAYRPRGQGIALVAGYGTGGPLAYETQRNIVSGVTDNEIFACAAAVIPIGCTAWLRIAS